GRVRLHERADRRRAAHQRQDSERARLPHPRQASCRSSDRGGCDRPAAARFVEPPARYSAAYAGPPIPGSPATNTATPIAAIVLMFTVARLREETLGTPFICASKSSAIAH